MKPNARRQSRSLAVQGVYSWQVSKNPIGDIEQQLLLEQNTKHLDVGYFHSSGPFVVVDLPLPAMAGGQCLRTQLSPKSRMTSYRCDRAVKRHSGFSAAR